MVLPDWLLYILPILTIAALGLLGGQIPADIVKAGRYRRPGRLGSVLLGSGLSGFALLVVPIYGAWGVILTILVGLAVWKRVYYIESDTVDSLWRRG